MQDLFLRLSIWISDKRGCGWFGSSNGTGFNPPASVMGWVITLGGLALIFLTFLLPPTFAWPVRVGLAVSLLATNWWTARPRD